MYTQKKDRITRIKQKKHHSDDIPIKHIKSFGYLNKQAYKMNKNISINIPTMA